MGNDKVFAWELWNEANVYDKTYLCPENYAYLLAEAKLRWPDLPYLGISLNSVGNGTAAATYMFDLAYRTDKSIWWVENYGNLPWDITMHHPYPGEPGNPEDFIPFQTFLMYSVVSWIPLWITDHS